MASTAPVLIAMLLLITLSMSTPATSEGSLKDILSSERMKINPLVRQGGRCRSRCFRGRGRAGRICGSRSCDVGRCRVRRDGVTIRRGFRCRRPRSPMTPTPTPTPMTPTPAPMTPDSELLFCNVGGLLALALPIEEDGVSGIAIFRTYGGGAGADRAREAQCIADDTVGIDEDGLRLLAAEAARAGCRPQTGCTITEDSCDCDFATTSFCFRPVLNQALISLCPP